MNDRLYNDLLEWCNYDLKEVEETINYFSERLKQDIDNENQNQESEPDPYDEWHDRIMCEK